MLLNISDNAAVGSLDMLTMNARGDVVNDPLEATPWASGSGVNARKDGLTTGTWLHVVAYFASDSSRQAGLAGVLGTANTDPRATTGLATSTIGAQAVGGTRANFLSGRIAEVTIASGFTTGDSATIIAQLAAGKRPADIAELAGSVDVYQPLRAGLNDPGYFGPAWTNVNVTFDAADHPHSIDPTSGLLFVDPLFGGPVR